MRIIPAPATTPIPAAAPSPIVGEDDEVFEGVFEEGIGQCEDVLISNVWVLVAVGYIMLPVEGR